MNTRPQTSPREGVAREMLSLCGALMSAMDNLETLLLVNPESSDLRDRTVVDLTVSRREMLRNMRLLRHSIKRQQDAAVRALL